MWKTLHLICFLNFFDVILKCEIETYKDLDSHDWNPFFYFLLDLLKIAKFIAG